MDREPTQNSDGERDPVLAALEDSARALAGNPAARPSPVFRRRGRAALLRSIRPAHRQTRLVGIAGRHLPPRRLASLGVAAALFVLIAVPATADRNSGSTNGFLDAARAVRDIIKVHRSPGYGADSLNLTPGRASGATKDAPATAQPTAGNVANAGSGATPQDDDDKAGVSPKAGRPASKTVKNTNPTQAPEDNEAAATVTAATREGGSGDDAAGQPAPPAVVSGREDESRPTQPAATPTGERDEDRTEPAPTPKSDASEPPAKDGGDESGVRGVQTPESDSKSGDEKERSEIRTAPTPTHRSESQVDGNRQQVDKKPVSDNKPATDKKVAPNKKDLPEKKTATNTKTQTDQKPLNQNQQVKKSQKGSPAKAPTSGKGGNSRQKGGGNDK